MWEVKKILIFLAHLSTARRVQNVIANDWIFLRNIKYYLDKKTAFHGFIRDILEKQTLLLLSETKADF